MHYAEPTRFIDRYHKRRCFSDLGVGAKKFAKRCGQIALAPKAAAIGIDNPSGLPIAGDGDIVLSCRSAGLCHCEYLLGRVYAAGLR